MSDLGGETEVNKRQAARFLFQNENQRDDGNDEEEKDFIEIEEDVELLSHNDYCEEGDDNDIEEDDLDDQPNQHRNKWRRSRGARSLLSNREEHTNAKSSKNNPMDKAKTTNKSNVQSAERHKLASETIMKREQFERQIDMFCEYVHILMHCFLYKLNYYNKKSHFDKLIKYNTIVYVIILLSSIFSNN